MNIKLVDGLPFISATIIHGEQQLKLDNILLDTGSGGTIFPTDVVGVITLMPEPSDEIHRIRGVGGIEYVFEKRIDHLEVGGLIVKNFVVEIGQVDYGFGIQGILGANFLTKTSAVIDLGKLTLG